MGRVPGIVKWLLAPALAALLGYKVIGPRMAGKVPLPRVVEERVGNLSPEPHASEAPATTPPPPKVSVDARPLADPKPAEDPAPKPRRKRRRRRARRTEEAPPEASPAPERSDPDPASTP